MRIIKTLPLLAFLLLVLSVNSCSNNDDADQLYERFENPPPEARPFVRWWWNGNSVDPKEIIRELDVMKAAGIGGVEINPIRMPVEENNLGIEPLVWLSPEWNNAVKTASERAKQNNMVTDMIVGSGWPFGGEFLEEGEIVQRVLTNQKDVTGPSVFTANADAILKEVPKGYNEGEFRNVLRSKILFMRLVPKDLKSLDDCIDVMSSMGEDGKIRIHVPDGEYRLIMGIWQEGHRRVTHGAPGSDGPVLDHLNSEAVQKYLDRLSTVLEKEFGAELGEYLRALFCDSIELAGANWTTDFMKKFEEVCGYSLEPYLQFVFYVPWNGYQDDQFNASPEVKDELRKVRYDYNRALVTIFLEGFTETFKKWCNDHGSLARYQAYGLPWLVGLFEGYMIADIPESNNWLYHDVERQGSVIWNKFASSAGHIGGKPIVSCEAMTNTSGVFKASLEQIKQNDDKNFITGINHSVLHGYNYSPPEAGFPGWMRYGAYFNEQNTWWPYFKLWADYNARLSYVFQKSQPGAEIVILGPTADEWSRMGLYRFTWNKAPWYCYQLWKTLSQNGITADYINESIMKEASFENEQLVLGKMKYDMIILTDVESVLPETAEKLNEYAKAGGKVLFVDQVPSRSPSYTDDKSAETEIQELLKEALEQPAVKLLDAPESEDKLAAWTGELVRDNGIEPAVSISEPTQNLYQIHNTFGKSNIYFFTNQSYDEKVEVTAGFKDAKGYPWKWDPETGERYMYDYGDNPKQFKIELEPLESLLLVFENRKGEHKKEPSMETTSGMDMNSEWQARFIPHIGETFEMNSFEMTDLGLSDDEMLNTFSGVVEFTKTFDAAESDRLVLDLGEVEGITEVYVNGKDAGTRWYGDQVYNLEGLTKEGKNELKVKLTTTLYNYCRTQEDNLEIRRWIGNRKPISSGIIGPVKLYN